MGQVLDALMLISSFTSSSMRSSTGCSVSGTHSVASGWRTLALALLRARAAQRYHLDDRLHLALELFVDEPLVRLGVVCQVHAFAGAQADEDLLGQVGAPWEPSGG
jgi:hypothetical protein